MYTSSDSNLLQAKEAWQSRSAAAAYRLSRNPQNFKRFQREDAILGSWLDDLPANSLILDIPCGAGRFVPAITRRGFRYFGADFSVAMISEAQHESCENPVVGFANADAQHLPFEDNSVDCVILWRFLHPVSNPKIRQSIYYEAARVARRKILISFHHTISFTNFRKGIQRFMSRTKTRAAFTHWRLKREAACCGMDVMETKGFRKYVSINWFASLSKAPH